MVAILEQDRFPMQSVISLSNNVPPPVVDKLYRDVARRNRSRFVVETEITCDGFVPPLVEVRLPAMIAVLMQYRLVVRPEKCNFNNFAARVIGSFHGGKPKSA